MQRLESNEISKIFKDAKASMKWLEENPDRESVHARRCLNIVENCVWLVSNNLALVMWYGFEGLDRIEEGL